MEKTMGSALNALKEQVKVGFTAKPDHTATKEIHAAIDRPVRIGDLILQAEAARDDLRHTGYGR